MVGGMRGDGEEVQREEGKNRAVNEDKQGEGAIGGNGLEYYSIAETKYVGDRVEASDVFGPT